MSTNTKWMWLLVNLFCTVVLTVQLVVVLDSYVHPTNTRTWDEEVMLTDIEFPLIFKICVIPGFNEKAVYDAGYYSTYFYFLGQSLYDNQIYGWAGHTPAQQKTVQEVLTEVTNYDIHDIIKEIYVWTMEKIAINIPLSYLKSSHVNYPHNCLSLELSNLSDLEGETIHQLFIVAGNITMLGNYSIQVQLRGDTLEGRRNVKDQSLFYSGDTIQIHEEKVSMSYMVEISQQVFVEEDPNHTCLNYPTKEYASYGECDDAAMRKMLPNITPIWLADDFAEVSTRVFDENGTLGNERKHGVKLSINFHDSGSVMQDLFDGTEASKCPLPCPITRTQTKLLNKFSDAETEIDITFSPKVRVTRTEMMKPTLTGFLAEVNESIIYDAQMKIKNSGWWFNGTLAGAGGGPSVATQHILPRDSRKKVQPEIIVILYVTQASKKSLLANKINRIKSDDKIASTSLEKLTSL